MTPPTPSPARRPYRCADNREITIACENESHWQALARCVGRPELAYAGDWQAAGTAPPDGPLARVLESLFAEDPAEVWLQRLQAHGVPCEIVRNGSP